MIITVACSVLVIAAAYSIPAHGDLEIYPGLKVNYVDDNRKYRLKKYDYGSYLSKLRYPLQEQQQPDEYPELSANEMAELQAIPDRIRQLRQIIDWEKAQLNGFGATGPMYAFDLERGVYREARPKPLAEQLPVLDEARMYPQEDEFRFDEAGPYEDDFQDGSDRYGEAEERQQASHHHMEQDVALTEEEVFPSGRLKDAKVVEDPTEFAYAPPNPMFYKKVEASSPEVKSAETDSISSAELKEVKPSKPDNTKPLVAIHDSPEMRVNQRSGMKVSDGNDMNQYRDIQGDLATWMVNQEVVSVKPETSEVDTAGVYIIAVVAGISAAATVGLIAVGIGWYKPSLHSKMKNPALQ